MIFRKYPLPPGENARRAGEGAFLSRIALTLTLSQREREEEGQCLMMYRSLLRKRSCAFFSEYPPTYAFTSRGSEYCTSGMMG